VIRLLLIGPLPPPMGGDTRHFTTLIEDLHAHGRFATTVVNTSRGVRHSRRLRNAVQALGVLARIAWRVMRSDVVSFQSSDRGMFMFAPFVVVVCRLAGRPAILRVFGGSFGDFYEKRGTLGRKVIRNLILSADVILLQTQRMVQQLQAEASGRIEWFSTYVRAAARPPVTGRSLHRGEDRCCSFVFLGHLWRAKGVDTILSAAPQLPEECRIDMYGPCDEYSPDDVSRRGAGRVRYCGFLTHAQVQAKLWDYDCLVLPTHHPGEGYPGVIAEAFAHEIPVITTRWLAIPEIVDDECGVLIEPGDVGAFAAAVAALHRDRSLWLRLKAGAKQRAQRFDHAMWSRRFEEICETLVDR
jgi:glycosyltransferase involved in cell wall biosynthesis